jgi:hypothetical protein
VGDTRRTFLVECYLPGVDEAAVAGAGDRARSAADELRNSGGDITYTGAVLMAADEVVFHEFCASDPGIVEAASRQAGLAFERIVESIEITGAEDTLPSAATMVDGT